MKLQRYYQKPETSWSWIGLKTLLPVVGVKVLGEFMPLETVNASAGATISTI